MSRTQTLLVTTAMALALPLASAMAQTASTSCGPETWSTDKMTYVKTPCTGAETVGTSGPTANAANSTTMIKQEMKQGAPYAYGAAPMQSQAVAAGPGYASMNDQCGPSNTVAVTDEYGRKYNCRGDRIR
jgi:hypothetical protein